MNFGKVNTSPLSSNSCFVTVFSRQNQLYFVLMMMDTPNDIHENVWDELNNCSCGYDLLKSHHSPLNSIAILESVVENPLENSHSGLKKWYKNRWRIALLLCIVGIICFIIVDSICCKNVSYVFESGLDYLETHKFEGSFLFVLLFTIATIVLFPPIILTYAGGLAYSMCFGLIQGTILGTIMVLLGALFGSILAFLLGRFVIKDAVTTYCQRYRLLNAINIAVKVFDNYIL